jgi:thiamine kinase-like enzyme
VSQCDILYARYKTFLRRESWHKSFLCVCCRVAVSDGAGRQLGTQLFYAKAYLDGGSRLGFHTASTAKLVAPRFGRALAHLPELDLILWAFPNDPELPHLPAVMDGQKVLSHLPYERLFAGIHVSRDITDVNVDVIHYYPEERCTSRYSLRSGNASSARTLTLIGKTYQDERGHQVYRRMQNLWEIAQQQGDFAVAEPLGYDGAVKTVWQKDMPGVPAHQIMTTTAKRAEWLQRIAAGLASLHCSVPAGAANYGVSDPIEDLHNKTAKLCHAFPHLQEPLQALRHSLEQSARQRAALAPKFIHGDFHLRQLLADGERIVFLDFDECALGDPLQDIASFIVDLHFYDFSPAEVAQLGAVFLQAYRNQSGWDVPRDRLDWHIRVQFLTKAYRAYRQHLPDREQRVRTLLALARRDTQLAEQGAMLARGVSE